MEIALIGTPQKRSNCFKGLDISVLRFICLDKKNTFKGFEIIFNTKFSTIMSSNR